MSSLYQLNSVKHPSKEKRKDSSSTIFTNMKKRSLTVLLSLNPITRHPNQLEIRYPEIFNHQSLSTELLQDKIVINIENINKEDLYEYIS